MTWLRSLGPLEYIFICCFIILYAIYIVRIILIARKMKSNFRKIFYKFFIRSFYFFLLLIALLGPSFGNVKKEIKSISKQIYLVTDISLSMNANDIQPSRIEKAKQELKKMVKAFNSDKVGLIMFGNTAYVQCPPTYDQSALNLFIESLSSDLLSDGGSDLSSGLILATEQLGKSTKSDFKKVIILITDGEDFSGKTKEAIKIINKNNIQLFVLGIGTEKGGSIPIYGALKKDKEGKIVNTSLKRELLNEIAEEAEGKYYEVSDKINETDYIINATNKIEGTVSDTREVDSSANKYFYFLLIALFFIIIDVVVTVRTVKI
jgi:Ca-activated chloride channel family protein